MAMNHLFTTLARLEVSHAALSAGLADAEAAVTVTVSVTNNGEWEAGPSSEVVMVFGERSVRAAHVDNRPT